MNRADWRRVVDVHFPGFRFRGTMAFLFTIVDYCQRVPTLVDFPGKRIPRKEMSKFSAIEFLD